MKSNLGKMYALGTLAFILFLSTLIGGPVLPALSVELGASPTRIPIVVSAGLATVVIAQLLTGVLADRYSVRTLVLSGALVGAISSFLCAVAVNWVQLAVFRVVGGLADAIAMPALLVATASLAEHQSGKFFGILRGSQGLSFAVGPALGAAFSLISLRSPFIADGTLSLIAGLASFLLLRDTTKAKSEHDVRLLRGLKSTFADKRIFLYVLMGISGLFAWGILGSFVPTKAQTIGLEAWQIGAIVTGGAIAFSIISYTVGAVTDRLGRRAFVILAQAIMLAAVAGLIRSESFGMLMLFYALFCIGEATTYLLCFVYASKAFDQRYMGSSMAALDSIMDFSLFVAPLIAISLYSVTGQISPTFVMAVIPAAIALFVLNLWLPRDDQ